METYYKPLISLHLLTTALLQNATVLASFATTLFSAALPSHSSFLIKIKEKEKKSREKKGLTRATVLTSCLYFGPRNFCRATPKTVALL
ncbi:hypothetical protein [Pandoraea sputorum]|uniref:hypothetical protein n=1 Tax=Pandoraea sputorum TaxID=93222 RepID=UPI00123F036B|nr:hypothetical protein [Pandoraea sputorum]